MNYTKLIKSKGAVKIKKRIKHAKKMQNKSYIFQSVDVWMIYCILEKLYSRNNEKNAKLYIICLLDLHDKYLPSLRRNACGGRKLYFCTHHTILISG